MRENDPDLLKLEESSSDIASKQQEPVNGEVDQPEENNEELLQLVNEIKQLD